MRNLKFPRLQRYLPIILVLSISAIQVNRTRKPVDPVGFATQAWQMDSVMNRIFNIQGKQISAAWDQNRIAGSSSWKVAICPHDDYAYAGWLYPAVLRNVNASAVILIGVAHKARNFGLENRMVFGSFDQWAEPYGPVRISALSEKIMSNLPVSSYVVHDSMQQAEHSLEALVPFLQHYNRKIEIVPILVPYMSFNTMEKLSADLAHAITKVMQDDHLSWNRDVAIVISNDAVHYGDQDWGGQDYAPYGCDSAGYRKAIARENEIIDNCLLGELSVSRIRKFTEYTVQDTNYRAYKWTWCGRYAVPFGLLTSLFLAQDLGLDPVKGTLLGYSNSIMQPAIKVSDLGMGVTAVANLHHWVGYTAIGYR